MDYMSGALYHVKFMVISLYRENLTQDKMELLILAAVVVAVLVFCYILWRDSKKRYQAYMESVKDLNTKLDALLAGYDEMDKELDNAEDAMRNIDKEIDEVKQFRNMLLSLPHQKSSLNN